MKLRSLLTLALGGLLSAPMTAQTDFKQDYAAFTGVAVNAGIEAKLIQSDAHGIEVKGSAAAIAELEVKLNGSTLEIGYREGAYERMSEADREDVVATVSLARLERILANGGAEVASDATWTADALKILANGGAEIHLAIAVESADILANGGAEIHLRGRATKLKANANGSAALKATDLISDAVSISANGGAEIAVHATTSLSARANGGSDIVYAGKATDVDVRTNGGSSVKAQ